MAGGTRQGLHTARFQAPKTHAASYPYEGDFAKIVAIAGDCHFGVESHTPLLTALAQRDEWYARSQRRCSDFSRAQFESLTVPEEAARDAILEFLVRQYESGGIKLRIVG